MWKQIEGSRAVAETVAMCRPQVICAYPITPQTHIVEGLGEMVKSGALAGCDLSPTFGFQTRAKTTIVPIIQRIDDSI